MIVRLALAVMVLGIAFLVWRNLGSQLEFRAAQRRAWDEPLREGTATVLTASNAAWWWFAGLAAVEALIGRALFERMAAGEGVAETFWHWLLFLVVGAVAGRRAVQLSEKVTVSWERIVSRNLLGERYAMNLAEATGVSEDDRTARIAFRGGRVLELSPWLEGRFWLARELKKRLAARP
ncbi:MAG: hypothetical protein VYD87_08340 [Pseudomonadota bacterium]|nr:hypothetical protein [Pseudomonadota bacterium]